MFPRPSRKGRWPSCAPLCRGLRGGSGPAVATAGHCSKPLRSGFLSSARVSPWGCSLCSSGSLGPEAQSLACPGFSLCGLAEGSADSGALWWVQRGFWGVGEARSRKGCVQKP